MSGFFHFRPNLRNFFAIAVTSAVTLLTCACSSSATVQASTPASETKPLSAVATASVTKPEPANSPAGLSYVAKRGDTTQALARHYLSQSSLMTVSELDAAIRTANGMSKTATLKPGQEIKIPTLEAQPVVEKAKATPKESDVRAIYLTGIMAGSARGMEIVRHWKQLGGNAVVFDIKDSDGSLSVPFQHQLAPKRRPNISNLPKFARFLHAQGMHSIARIALFRDENIAQNHSEFAIHSKATGKPWLENGKLVWTDPSRPEVQQYNLALAKFVAASGVDEIQFDYVRFPAEGNQKDAAFTFERSNVSKNEPLKTQIDSATGTAGAMSSRARLLTVSVTELRRETSQPARMERRDVIANFLAKAYSELHPMGVLVSLDVFGVMAWQRSVDLAHTGQDIVLMAQHCDVLSPMIYPSHFFGMDGYALPGDAPEHFIGSSMERFHKVTAGSGVVLRPWLQAFGWKTKSYSPEYIRVQVMTSKQRGGIGFLLWNANNDYSKPFAAMPSMMAATDRYFGKAEALAVVAAPATKHPGAPATTTPAVTAPNAPSQAPSSPASTAPARAASKTAN